MSSNNYDEIEQNKKGIYDITHEEVEKEKEQQRMYAIMIEEVEMLHREQESLDKLCTHFTGHKIKIAAKIIEFCKMLDY